MSVWVREESVFCELSAVIIIIAVNRYVYTVADCSWCVVGKMVQDIEMM